MAASKYSWGLPDLIGLACLFGLASCAIWLWPRPGSSKVLVIPGQEQFNLGRKLLADGDAKDAVSAFTEAIDRSSGYAPYYVNRAKAHEALKETEKAIDDYTLALRANPEYAEALYGRAALFLQKGFPEQAIVDLNEAVRLVPDSYQAVLLRAQADLAAKKYAEAIDDARSAICLNAENGEAYFVLGSALLASPNQEPDKAIDYFTEAIRRDKSLTTQVAPELAQAYFQRGRAYLKNENTYQAIMDFTEAIRLKPDDAKAYLDRAEAYSKGNDLEFALANLDDAVKLEKKLAQRDRQFEYRARDLYVEIYQSQARAYADARQWQKVVDRLLAIDKLPLLKPTNYDPIEADRRRQMVQAYQEMGSDHLKSKNWEEAIQSFEQAISLDKSLARQINPQLAQAYAERGFDHAKHRNFREAGLDLNMALGMANKLDKDYVQIYRLCGLTSCLIAEERRQRGLFSEDKGYWKDAARFLKWAIWLDPGLEYELRPRLRNAEHNFDWLRPLQGGWLPGGFIVICPT